MTISNTIRTAGPYIGNGITTAFPFTFKVFKKEEVLAVQTDVSTGVATPLVLNSGYSVVLNADQNASPGGTATTALPLATGQTLVLTSDLAYLQPLDITNGGGFYPSVLNAALDRLTIFCQQLFSLASRSLKFPLSDTGMNTELPSATARSNKLLGFDSLGRISVVAPVSGSAADVLNSLGSSNGVALVGSAAWYAQTITGFNSSLVPDGATIIFSGRSVSTDGGGGAFTFYRDSIQAADGGMVFAPAGGGRLLRNGWTVLGYSGVPHVSFWGARPDKSEGAGLALAVAYANANRCNLDVSNGNYGTNATLKLSVFWKFIGNKTATIIALVSMTSVLAIGPDQLGAQDNSASNYNMGGLDGITVDANSLATHAAFYGDGEYNVTGYQTRDCKFINSNSDAVKTGENFFINQFFGCAFNNCSGNSFYLGQGNNAGENISFYGCGFFNAGQSGLFCQNSGPGGASVNLHGCSFDYNQNWAIENGTTTANGTIVSVFGGHIENFKQYALNYGTLNFTDVAMFGGAQSGTFGYLIDNQGGMTIRGGWIQNAGSGVQFNPAGLPYHTPDPVINVPSSYPLMQVGAAGTLVPTTIYQNKTGAYMELSVPFTFGVGAGRVLGFVGPTGAEFLVASRTGNSNAVEEYLTIRVPPFYFYQVNISGSAGLSAGHIYSYG